MELKRTLEWAVVLSPAIICLVLAISVGLVPALSRFVLLHYRDSYTVELAKELIAHGAFYGSAIAVALGYKKESVAAYVVATIWFAFATYVA